MVTGTYDTPPDAGSPGGPGFGLLVGQDLAQVDPVEQALADALILAAQAGRFDTVEVLSRELGARRLARRAPEVATIEAERAKREQKR